MINSNRSNNRSTPVIVTERPGRLSREEALRRLLDALAAVPRRRRAGAIRTLGLRLERRDVRFLLTLVRVYEEAPTARFVPTLQDGRDC